MLTSQVPVMGNIRVGNYATSFSSEEPKTEASPQRKKVTLNVSFENIIEGLKDKDIKDANKDLEIVTNRYSLSHIDSNNVYDLWNKALNKTNEINSGKDQDKKAVNNILRNLADTIYLIPEDKTSNNDLRYEAFKNVLGSLRDDKKSANDTCRELAFNVKLLHQKNAYEALTQTIDKIDRYRQSGNMALKAAAHGVFALSSDDQKLEIFQKITDKANPKYTITCKRVCEQLTNAASCIHNESQKGKAIELVDGLKEKISKFE